MSASILAAAPAELPEASTDTLARMFWRRAELRAGEDARMVKRDGIWHRLTWREVGTAARDVAFGLMALGRRPADTVALLSASRAEWVDADFAILSIGGVTVPIYPTFTVEQIAHIVNETGAKTLIVDTPAQLARVLEARAALPGLEQIVVMEGIREADAFVVTWEAVRRRGQEHADRFRRELADRVSGAAADDIATIVYTSGTTGEPKGVVQTHANHLAALRSLAQIPGTRPGDVHLLFLPLAHSFARMEAFVGVHRGLVTAFAEGLDRVPQNLREVRPHVLFGVPRVFEKARERVLSTVATASPARRRLFAWALRVGLEVSRRRREGRVVPVGLALRYRLAERAVFSKLLAAFGGRLRFAVSGGAPLPIEVAEFFHAAGLLIVEGYGLTEACPALTFNRIDHFKFGSVGQAVPGVELRLAPDGEVLARGSNVATRGYWKRPDATADSFDAEGWLHTGDIGRIDDEGFLFLTDRKKELIVTSGGVNIATQHVETLLRRDPFISQAVLYGDRRPYPTALITVSPQELTRFAREQGILVADHPELARHPLVRDRVRRAVDAANAELPSYARVKRFAVLPVELTEAAGEITPTQKVRRRVVAEKYGTVIESLYRQEVA